MVGTRSWGEADGGDGPEREEREREQAPLTRGWIWILIQMTTMMDSSKSTWIECITTPSGPGLPLLNSHTMRDFFKVG